jgi:hypothetical protein
MHFHFISTPAPFPRTMRAMVEKPVSGLEVTAMGNLVFQRQSV